MLAGETGIGVDSASQGQTCLDRHGHSRLVEDGKSPRQTQAYRTGVGIRRRSELGAAGAENLALGEQLSVNFKTDNGFKFQHRGAHARARSVDPMRRDPLPEL